MAILVAAMATRLGFLGSSPDHSWPHSVCFEGDAPLWVRYAASLQRGEPFEFGLPIHTPGMAYLLRWTGAAGPAVGFTAHKVALCVLGAASCVLAWVLARRVFTQSVRAREVRSIPRPSETGQGRTRPHPIAAERVAVIAGLLSAGSFALTVQATSLNNESPYTFLLLLIGLLTLRVAERRTWASLLVLGGLNGVAVLFRAEHTLLVALLGVYLAWRWRQLDSANVGHGGPTPRDDDPRRPRRRSGHPGAVLGLTALALGYFVVPLPWNIRSYRAIQRFNAVEPRRIDFEAARPPWTPEAVAFMRDLPAFAREGNFWRLSDLAAAAGMSTVTREFVERWFCEEAGYVPRPLSPWTFVSNQGPLCFALANHAGADGGFSTALLDGDGGPAGLSFGYPGHLRIFQHGYRLGLHYLVENPAEALRLLGRKLAIFGSGLTQGLTPLNAPLGIDGPRRPADQWAPTPGTGWLWTGPLLAVAAIGLWTCVRRRAGGLVLIVLGYKAVITVLFFGYVRQAASVLPFFFVLVALGLETVVFAPLLRHWPRLGKAQVSLVTAAAAAIVGMGVLCSTRSVRYDVFGGIDRTPQWGPGAFESHQPLSIRQFEAQPETRR